MRNPKLEDLYVKPEFRAGGVGKAFFGHLGKIAQEKVDYVSLTSIDVPVVCLKGVEYVTD